MSNNNNQQLALVPEGGGRDLRSNAPTKTRRRYRDVNFRRPAYKCSARLCTYRGPIDRVRRHMTGRNPPSKNAIQLGTSSCSKNRFKRTKNSRTEYEGHGCALYQAQLADAIAQVPGVPYPSPDPIFDDY